MKNFSLPIYKNPLKTKKDVQQAFVQLTDPLNPYFSKGRARLHIGNTSASYPDFVAEMEGFSRVLWGLAPFTAGGKESDLWDIYIEGIKNGTNPNHEEYWGDIQDYDQRAVEMAAIGLALALVPEKVWEPLSETEKNNFSRWLLQINSHELWGCNWLFFRVIVNIGLKKVGIDYDEKKVQQALDVIDEFYIGNGWYADGKGGHSDYYVPFAIHYYSLVYAKLMENEDPKRSKIYKERAAIFAKDFINWFAEDGAAIPYGRSQTYRFAQSAFWSALVYAGVDVFPMGVVKGIILRNLRWWLKKPIFNPDGTLTVGYAYPNLVMAENYNSPGSPYWALKTFLILDFPDDHSFWTSEEKELPALDKVSVQVEPHMVICRNEKNSSLMAFNSGHTSTNNHTHTSAKYEKFVYSTAFGFSVPRAEWGLDQGAFDSMLAISEEDNIYRVKRYCEDYKIDENVIYSRWKPWNDVEVKTWIIAGNPWHVRVHVIDTSRSIDTAEGGFALGIENYNSDKCDYKIIDIDRGIYVKSSCGTSGIIDLCENRKQELILPNSNTNIMYSRTAIPTLKSNLKPGKYYFAAAVFGDTGNVRYEEAKKIQPNLEIKENKIYITSGGISKVISL